MQINKTLKVILGILAVSIFMYLGAYMMSPGSNSRAEYYRVDVPRGLIIEKVAEFKELHPEYKYTRLDTYGDPFIYVEDKPTAFFLNLPSLDVSVVCIITEVNGESLVGLVSAEGHGLEKYKGGTLNTGQLSRKDNQEVKKAFETEFLDHFGKWERVFRINSFFGLYF